LACCFTLSLSLFAQSSGQYRFPIPAGFDKVWPSAKFSESEGKLLRAAVETDLRDSERYGEEKCTFDDVDKTTLPLGKLGNGIFVATNESCGCRRNCSVYLYVHEKDGYREILRNGKIPPVSWAFALVNSNRGVPDIVLASGDGGREVGLTRYRYTGGRFVRHGCERLVAKNWPDFPKSWWDPSQVIIQPCQK